MQLLMIKGLMGCPERLNGEIIDNSFVEVVGKSGKTRMKLKVKYAYCYDEGMYNRLKNAFDLNSSEKLAQEWQQAKTITSLLNNINDFSN